MTPADFGFQPAIERSRIDTLVTCAWVHADETLLIQEPPDAGKTDIAVGLGVKALEHVLSAQIFRLDELGFEPMDRQAASLLLRLVSYRYGRGSILITTTKSARDWTELLAGDEALTTTILDRLLHNAQAINIIKGRRYRLRDLGNALASCES
jgi:DNA replication protein DnaC